MASASAGIPLHDGSADSTKFTFAHGPAILIAETSSRNSAGKRGGLDHPEERAFGIGIGQHDLRLELVAPSRTTPVARPSRTCTRATGDDTRISPPASRTAAAIAWVIDPIPPTTWP